MDCDGASGHGRAAGNAITDRAVGRPDTAAEAAIVPRTSRACALAQVKHSAPAARRGAWPPRRQRRRRVRCCCDCTNVDLYVGYRAVLRAVNWQLRQGEHWSVFGANGAGKSSFLKLLYGDLSPALGGKIERVGFPPARRSLSGSGGWAMSRPNCRASMRWMSSCMELVASGRHASIGLAAPMTAADLEARARLAQHFSNCSRLPSAGRANCPTGNCAARSSRAPWRRIRKYSCWTNRSRVSIPRSERLMKRLLERLMRRHVTIVAAVHHAEDLPRGMTHGLHLHKRHACVEDSYFAT